jgi:hypothetical protein
MNYKCVHIHKKNAKEVIVFQINDSDTYTSPLNKSSALLQDFNVSNTYDTTNTRYTLANDTIYEDDTIHDIKVKLSQCLNVNVNEIYVFSQVTRMYNVDALFDILRQNSTNSWVSKSTLSNFMANIGKPFKLKKAKYTYDDLLNMGFTKEYSVYLINKALGNKYALREEFPVITNPYMIDKLDLIVQSYSKDIVSSTNNEVLLDNEYSKENILYICTFEDVQEFATEKLMDIETISTIYFPLLDINNLEQENSKNKILIEEYTHKSKKIHTIKSIQNQKNVLKYGENGVKELKCVFHTTPDNMISLELLFKHIKTSEKVPFIKYNPSKVQDSILRVYSKNNVPYLSKTTILRIHKDLSKKTCVGYYLPVNDLNYSVNATTIFIELKEDGSIMLHLKLSDLQSHTNINEFIQNHCSFINTLFQNISKKYNYTIANIGDIYDYNVEIINIIYETTVNSQKQFSIENYRNLLHPLFSFSNAILSSNTPLSMRYKRISNFNNMNSIYAFITDLTNQNYDQDFILSNLVQSYSLSIEDAVTQYTNWSEDVKLRKNVYNRNKTKLILNPGFPMTITKNRTTQFVTVNINGIQNFRYLSHIPGYIDALFRLGFNKTDLGIEESFQNENETSENKDVISKSEEALKLNEETILKNDELDRIHKSNLLFDDEENEFNIDSGDDSDDSSVGINNMLLDSDNDSDKDSDNDSDNDSDKDSDTTNLKENLEEKYDYSSSESDIDIDTDTNIVKGGQFKYVDEKTLHDTSLRYPNYFQARLENRENIFLTQEDGKNLYSRFCQTQHRKQPIILNEEEKKYIDENSKGAYNYALKYQSEENKEPHYYICPKYWCFYTNTPMTLEQIQNGECGNKTKIIPRNATKIPTDAYAYEFSSDRDKDQSILKVPGMSHSKKTKICVPCCFKDLKTAQKSIKSCNAKLLKYGENDKTITKTKHSNMDNKIKRKVKEDKYIINSETFPLEKGRIGYLDPKLEEFLMIDSQCKQSQNKIPTNKHCLLRLGVEKSNTQSFLSVVAEYYSEYEPQKRTLSVKEIKEVLVEAIDLDKYVVYLNGSLPELFREKREIVNSIDISKYMSSKLYKAEYANNNDSLLRFKMTCASYEKYIKYLRDSNVEIDFTYILEFISSPNPKLFPKGLNMFILQVPNDDMTSKIQFVCPPTKYMNLTNVYSDIKPSVLIVKKYNYYEPIVQYSNNTKVEFQKLFGNEYKIVTKIQDTFNIIKKAVSQCNPKPSLPKLYNMKQNKLLKDVAIILKKYNIKIQKQIVNYNERVVALLVVYSVTKNVIIPIQPSGISSMYAFEYIDSNDNWSSYTTTRDRLNEIKKLTQNDILCEPLFKVVENDIIVGIITETDQFVPIEVNMNESIDSDNLKILYANNPIEIDKKTLLNNNTDIEINKLSKKLKLENQFYYAFRNTLRYQLQRSTSLTKIKKTISDISLFYEEKRTIILPYIEELIYKHISFVSMTDKLILSLPNIETCYSLNTEQCSKTPYCLISDDCKLQIPNKNLIEQTDNKVFYTKRFIEEIIQYGIMREAILDKDNYIMNDNDLEYQLHENEIIVSESSLDSLFDNYKIESNQYINNGVVDYIQPFQTKKYSNTYKDSRELREESRTKSKPDSFRAKECIQDIRKASSGVRKMFNSKNIQELEYVTTPLCMITMFKDILEEMYPDKDRLTNEELMSTLLKLYSLYYNNLKNIYSILKEQGKSFLVKLAESNRITFEELIMDPEYFLTNLDILLLSEHYKIPLILFTTGKGGLKELKYYSGNKKYFFNTYTKSNSKYFFIRQPGNSQQKGVIKYSVLSNVLNSYISHNVFSEEFSKFVNENSTSENQLTIEDYILHYHELNTYNKTKNLKLASN